MASERVTTAYSRLFELYLLNHFWLDEGATGFDALSADAKTKRLLSYDVRNLLSISPTESTLQVLAGIHGVFKETALGAVVAVPTGTVVPDDALFEFVVVINTLEFFNYTSLTLTPQKVVGLFHPPSESTIRFKENVGVFSNLTGVSRGSGLTKSLFLSQEFPSLGSSDKAESIVNVSGALVQLTSDQPGASQIQIAPVAADSPVFVHQADIPAITPPVGIVGTPPARGITLTDEIGPDTYAVIRIAATRPSNTDFSCTSSGVAKTPHPVFQIRFKNRSSVWRYFSKTNPSAAISETAPLPLTHFGNASSGQKPSGGLITLDRTGSVVNKIVAQVFI